MSNVQPGKRLRTALRLGVATALAAAAVVPLSADLAGAAGGGSCPGTPDKCYSFTMSSVPGVPKPGESATYTGKLSNLSKGGGGVQLGAANITWSPSNAFSSVTPGSVSRAGATETLNGSTLELRNLNTPPGSFVTFTFQATSLEGQQITFPSTAKQSNNYSGTGNDLTLTGGSPSVTISQFCSDGVTYNAYGCKGFAKTAGATINTGSLDSQGNPSLVTASLVIPPVTPAAGSPATQVMALRSYIGGGDMCPAVVPCNFTVQLLNKLDIEYDGGHPSVLTVNCGTLCTTLTVYFQQDEASGTTEPLPPCLPISIPSPLTGSTACYDLALNGSITVRNITHANDWKVMGIGT